MPASKLETAEGQVMCFDTVPCALCWHMCEGVLMPSDLQATVREALLFSARLRLPSTISKAQMEAFVEEVSWLQAFKFRTFAYVMAS